MSNLLYQTMQQLHWWSLKQESLINYAFLITAITQRSPLTSRSLNFEEKNLETLNISKYNNKYFLDCISSRSGLVKFPNSSDTAVARGESTEWSKG